jgi:hypothetical protein
MARIIDRIVEETQTGWDGHAERLAGLRQTFLNMVAGLSLVSETPYKKWPGGALAEDSSTVRRNYAPVVLSVFPDKPESTETRAVLALPYVKHGPTTVRGSVAIEHDAQGKAVAWQSTSAEGPLADLEYGFDVVRVDSDSSPDWSKHITAFRHDMQNGLAESGAYSPETSFAPFLREIVELER